MKKYILNTILLCSLTPFTANAASILSTGNTDYGDKTNSSVVFNLTGLGSHTEVNLNFDLYIMDSWDGNIVSSVGPDYFGFKIDGVVQQWTFKNFFPDSSNESNIDSSWNTGNYNSITTWGSIDRQFVDYADGFTIAHTGNTLNLEFFGAGLQGINDESWRVREISLSTENNATVPEPSSLALLGLGLAGFSLARKKKSV